MASILLATAGSAIGSNIGGPLGGFVGKFIGTALGSTIDDKIFGPRKLPDATDTVTIRAFNVTGSAINPASQTFRVTVTNF